MIHHDKCEAFEQIIKIKVAKIKELEAKNVEIEKKLKIAVEALENTKLYLRKDEDKVKRKHSRAIGSITHSIAAIKDDAYTYSKEHFNDIANGRD